MALNYSHLSVLLIDDQEDVRETFRDMLTDRGIKNIQDAPDGQQALELMGALEKDLSLIICDWNMPGMSGIDFFRAARALQPDVPFLMITGRGDMDSIVEAKSSGVSAYLRKPFTPAQFDSKLEFVLDQVRKAA